MNHIKSYKLFEGIEDEVKSIVNDILSDLTDKGFQVICYTIVDAKSFMVEIDKKNNSSRRFEKIDLFSWMDIKNSITHLISYLQDTHNLSRFTGVVENIGSITFKSPLSHGFKHLIADDNSDTSKCRLVEDCRISLFMMKIEFKAK